MSRHPDKLVDSRTVQTMTALHGDLNDRCRRMEIEEDVVVRWRGQAAEREADLVAHGELESLKRSCKSW